MVTPERGIENCADQTTGRKSDRGRIPRKARPRDKGLRKLSERAYEILMELRHATYKEVAGKLVRELKEES